MKRILALLPGLLLLAQLWAQPVQAADLGQLLLQEEETKETKEKADGAELQLSAPSALLMEASTGQVIYEKNPDDPLPPASVTKVMTLLLIFDALEEGKIHLEDEVTTSEYAASMGGSQVFLEPGEVQTVDTLIKCIAVASANDACVAMAEKVRGSEEAFVEEMNQRAKELGMENTTFVNCNGLDAEGHLTTARDIALMSRELITSYPQVRDYCMIWMEDITHTTRKGTSTFGLSNTNKLVRHYEYATGLKTGSTSKAGFCISATAEKEGMELIGVIMAARTSKERTKRCGGPSQLRVWEMQQICGGQCAPDESGAGRTGRERLRRDHPEGALCLSGHRRSGPKRHRAEGRTGDRPGCSGEEGRKGGGGCLYAGWKGDRPGRHPCGRVGGRGEREKRGTGGGPVVSSVNSREKKRAREVRNLSGPLFSCLEGREDRSRTPRSGLPADPTGILLCQRPGSGRRRRRSAEPGWRR